MHKLSIVILLTFTFINFNCVAADSQSADMHKAVVLPDKSASYLSFTITCDTTIPFEVALEVLPNRRIAVDATFYDSQDQVLVVIKSLSSNPNDRIGKFYAVGQAAKILLLVRVDGLSIGDSAIFNLPTAKEQSMTKIETRVFASGAWHNLQDTTPNTGGATKIDIRW